MEYYEWVAPGATRHEGVYRRAVPGSALGDEVFHVPLRAWEFTTELSRGLRHISDDDFEQITVEQARARLAALAPELDPDEILARPSRVGEG